MTAPKKRPRRWKPRGPTGSVRGISGPAATRILEALVEALVDVRPPRRRMAAAALLRERWGFQEALVEGFLHALQRLPGVRTGEAGEIFLPKNAKAHARHREWRIATGQLNLAAAAEAADLLVPAKEPSLKRLAERLCAASAPLLEE